MPSIAYDQQIFYSQKYGGISRYFCEIAPRIAKLNDFDVQIIAGAYINKYLIDVPKNLVVGFHLPPFPKTSRLRLLFNNELSKFWVTNYPPQIIHQTYYLSENLFNKKSKRIITLYDMIYEKFPQLFGNSSEISFAKSKAIKQADHIICISENTKTDLLEFYPNLDPNKISVTYLASSLESKSITKKIDKIELPTQPYILYVGERLEYKNFHRLVESYAISQLLKKDFQILCFGGGEFSAKELEMMQNMGLSEDRVIQISGDDSMLAYLYSKASAFVYPSIYEGFGIPPLEAMSLGCPVICSNNSSLPEVVGNAAELFDPYEIESICTALERVLYSEDRQKNLIGLAKERIKHFSWDKSAQKTASIYSSLL